MTQSPWREILFKPEKRLIVLFGLGVGLTPLAPALLILYLTRHWLGALSAAFFLSFLLAGVGLRKESTTWLTVASIPYWLLVFLTQIILFPVAWMMNPVFCTMAIILSIAALASRFYLPLASIVPIIGFSSMIVLTAVDMIPASLKIVLGVAALGLVGAAVLIWFARHRAFARLGGLMIALFVFNMMTFPRGFMNYKVPFPGDLAKVLSQPGIEAIYTYADPRIASLLPSQIMFMARVPQTNSYILGPHDPFKKLYLLHPGDPPLLKSLDFGGRGGDNCVFDPDDNSAFYILGRDSLHRVSTNPLRITDTLELGYSIMPLSYLRYDHKNDALIAVRTLTDKIFVIDRRSLTVLRQLPFPTGTIVKNAWLDATHGKLFVTGNSIIGWKMIVYDTTTWTVIHENHWFSPSIFNFIIDPQGRKGYLGSILAGFVYVIDLDSLEVLESFFLGIGTRGFNFDPLRRLFIATSQFDGRLHIYDVDKRTFVAHPFIGKRGRWNVVDLESRRWFLTSSVGGFAIDPELLLSEQ